MTTKTRRGVAALAVAAMAGGLLPFLAAGVASAVTASEPTAVTVVHSAGYAALGGNGSFTVNLTGAVSPLHGVGYIVESGPDTNVLAHNPCTSANGANTSWTCAPLNGGTAGVSGLRFYYDSGAPTDTFTYAATDYSVTGTMTIGGPIAQIVNTPASTHVGLGGYTKVTVAVTDGATPTPRPVTGASVVLTAVPGATVGATPPVAANYDVQATSTAPTGQYTGAGTGAAATGTTEAGVATFYVATDYLSNFSVTATVRASAGIQGSTAITVNKASANDATSVVLSPASQKAFDGLTGALVNVKVTNAQGDPIAGVIPEYSVAGVNTIAYTSGATATHDDGTTTITYAPNSGVGTDAMTVWINQTTSGTFSNAKDTGEPFSNAAVHISTEPASTTLTGPTAVTSPVAIGSAPVTFNLSTPGADSSGYVVAFSLSGGPASISLASANGTTDSNGNVTAMVVDSNPVNTDTVTVTATLIADSSNIHSLGIPVTWVDQSVGTQAVIAPFASTLPVHASTTHSVTLKDLAGNAVPNISYTWSVTSGNTAVPTGFNSTFTYTDAGALIGSTDTITVTAKNPSGATVGQDTVQQYWVPGTAQAAQAGISVGAVVGTFGTGPNYYPTGFVNSASAQAVTNDPTAGNPTATVIPVVVRVIDAHGNDLYGKSVTFSSSGVGGLTDSNGKPLQNSSSTTALVSDRYNTGPNLANGEGTTGISGGPVAGANRFYATAYVRSTAAGTQTITATVDGIANTATVTYTGQFVALDSPQRVLDTRSGQGGLFTPSGSAAVLSGGKLAPNTSYDFDFTGTNVPVGNASYAFNVTAISPSGPGNLRVVNECDLTTGVPAASLINYQAGKDVANFSVISNNHGGIPDCNKLRVYSDQATVAVAIDLVGYYPSITAVVGVASTRLVDTRTGLGGGTGKLLAGTSRSFQIATGGAGIPYGQTAVALNVTAIDPQGLGNLRVYADGAPVPNASNINYIKGVDKAAFVIVQLPANGKIDVYSDQVAVDVAIDAYAYFPASSTTVAITPTRVLDTRITGGGGTLAANTVRNVTVGGVNGIPADAQAVLVSVTSIHAASSTGFGNLRAYATGAAFPNVSTLNYVSKTADVANFAIVALSKSGQLSLYSSVSPIDVALDVVGYVPAGS